MKRWKPQYAAVAVMGILLCLSLCINAALGAQNQYLSTQMTMQRQRELGDVVAAMADIEVNLSKLLIASGASQSVSILGETALLAQHVESGLARLPLGEDTAADTLKFAGQMGQYALALAAQVSDGRMLTSEDERQVQTMMQACRSLNEHLLRVSEEIYTQPFDDQTAQAPWPLQEGEGSIPYPSLIYDGPFSDGRREGQALGLSGERVTREQAREAAARYAGVTQEHVRDAADSGGTFEAFGFDADTPNGMLSVQVTGQGGHLLWMMPQQAEFAQHHTKETCLDNARIYLADMGFGQMEPCFVQVYDGMVVANFAAVQEDVLLYPDQVKVQVSMDSGTVVGAECTQYLSNHQKREGLEPAITKEEAGTMLSSQLDVLSSRLCVIPQETGERLCWGFEGRYADADYWVFIDALTGEAAQILRVVVTQDGQTAV